MEGSCPRCRVRLEFPASGRYECERCRLRFEVALGSPFAPPAPEPPGVESPVLAVPASVAGLEAPCSRHARNAATHICERCGDFICRVCLTPAEGRAYCPRCFEVLHSRGSLAFVQRQFTAPGLTLAVGVTAFLSSLLSCVFFWATVPLAVLGLVIGARGLKEHALRPDLPHRSRTVAGLWLSALGLVVLFVQIGLFVWAAGSRP